MLWPRLGSIDVNGTPKLIPTDVVRAMNLESKDWFLDPEILIKAHTLGLRVLELNVFARMRGNGISHVRHSTCLEFIRNLIAYRFRGEWKQRLGTLQELGEGTARECLKSQVQTAGHR